MELGSSYLAGNAGQFFFSRRKKRRGRAVIRFYRSDLRLTWTANMNDMESFKEIRSNKTFECSGKFNEENGLGKMRFKYINSGNFDIEKH